MLKIFILNGMHKRGMNKDQNNAKIWKHPRTSSTDILDCIKHGLQKALEQIMIHNYL